MSSESYMLKLNKLKMKIDTDMDMDMVMKMLEMNTNSYTFPSFSLTSEKQSTINIFLLTIPNIQIYSTYSTMPGPTAASCLCAKSETA